jgi:hypothetical protein
VAPVATAGLGALTSLACRPERSLASCSSGVIKVTPSAGMLIVSPAAAAAPPKRLRAACFEIPRTVPISPQLRP